MWIIKNLEDLKAAISKVYKNSDQTQSFEIKAPNIGGGINLQYFSVLKEYQILGLTVTENWKKVEFSKWDKVKLIRWAKTQDSLYKLLSVILSKYI